MLAIPFEVAEPVAARLRIERTGHIKHLGLPGREAEGNPRCPHAAEVRKCLAPFSELVEIPAAWAAPSVRSRVEHPIERSAFSCGVGLCEKLAGAASA